MRHWKRRTDASTAGGRAPRYYELFLALRYLRSRRKQAFTVVVTAVSVLGVTVGVGALIIALALLTGFQEDIQTKIIGANAHVFIFSAGPGAMPEYRQVVAAATETPGVVSAAPAVLVTGLLTGGFEPAFVTVKGIEPRSEVNTTDLLERIVEGSAEGLDRRPGGTARPGIILGADLAASLLVGVGDQVRAIIPSTNMLTPFGVGIRPRYYEVIAIFEAGMFEYDSSWAMVSLSEAQELLEIGDAASLVQVRVEDIFASGAVLEELRERVGKGYLINDWQRMNEVFFSALKLEKLAMFIAIGLIVMVAALNIVANLVLLVMEKHRDIGILMSMGASRRGVLYTFMIQGLVIGLLGTLLGSILGVSTAVIFDRYRLIGLSEQVYYLSYVPFTVRTIDFTRICLFSVAISFLATIYPAWRASRLDPVEALGYE